MNEGAPTPPPQETSPRERRRERTLSLARELVETQEVFPFSGITPQSYIALKASDAQYPGYTTPTDDILARLEKEGMKVVFGDDPESGNVYIIPAISGDLGMDGIFIKHVQVGEQMSGQLRELIETSKQPV